MKKVLFVATVTGHINVFHLPYLKLFKDEGYEVHVVTGDDKKVKLYCDKKMNIGIKRNPFAIQNIKAILNLKKIIIAEKYDIIHCHTPMGGVVARLASKKARKKYGTRVIYTAHGFHFFKGSSIKNWLLFYPIEKYLSKYCDTLITINKEDYELAKKKFSSRCLDIRYVPGVGIDSSRFNFEMTKKEKNALRKSLNLKSDDFVLIFPARLDKNKNQMFLIECMKQLIKKYNNIHLLLPGKDELNGFYQEKAKEKCVGNNIHFLGSRSDVPKLLKISNIAVSSSLREGLPVNVMEAFICKLPVIALNCRGMSDLIKDTENGYLININDKNKIELFVNRVDLLYNNKELYNKIVSNTSTSVYDVEYIKKEMKKIYFD